MEWIKKHTAASLFSSCAPSTTIYAFCVFPMLWQFKNKTCFRNTKIYFHFLKKNTLKDADASALHGKIYLITDIPWIMKIWNVSEETAFIYDKTMQRILFVSLKYLLNFNLILIFRKFVWYVFTRPTMSHRI